MIEKKESFVLVGGSFTNILLAIKLKQDSPDREVFLIEKDEKLGGLYKSYQYENDLKFDLGVHLYTETEDPEIDEIVISSLSNNEWNVLEDDYRDIAGTFYNNKLQLNTSYVDLTNIPQNKKSKYLGETLQNVHNNTNPSAYKNCKEFLEAKFGKQLTNDIFKPIFEKHYSDKLENLDPMASLIIPVGRIAMLDNKQLDELMQIKSIRSRLAYSDQLNLPENCKRSSKLLYPQRMGIDNLTNALINKLKNLGVKILTNSYVTKINFSNKKQIKSVNVELEDKSSTTLELDHLVWGAGLGILAKQLDINLDHKFQIQKAAFVNLVLKQKPKMDPLYYFYVFDKNYSIFRFTNYASYCPGAKNSKGFPTCASVWLDNEHKSDESVIENTIKELETIGVINREDVVFSKLERTNSFPKMTIDNIAFVNKLRDEIEAKDIKNLSKVGILSSQGLFYLDEILRDAFQQIRKTCSNKVPFIKDKKQSFK